MPRPTAPTRPSARVTRAAHVAALAALAVVGIAAPAVEAQVRQPHAGMLRFPDVSAEHITFVYANDLWIAPREGGMAMPLASPAGPEMMPRFSADGQTIAFMGNFEGGRDLYTVTLDGVEVQRVTHHPASERLSDWTPDGDLLFSAYGMTQGNLQTMMMYHVGAQGGLPTKLPIPYGTNGTVSPDGVWLAYTPSDRDLRSWKRYEGGLASDIWLFNLETGESRRVTDFTGTDTAPMWHGERLLFLSDRAESHRLNLYAFDPASGETTQLTGFAEHDVKFPAIGPGPDGGGEVVFQLGSDLMLLDLATGESKAVEVTVPGVRSAVLDRRVDVSGFIQSGDVSATGQRAVVEARGDIWTLPAEDGPPRNLTQTPEAIDRNPSWSPDGRWVAYSSDANGEYNVYITQSDGKGETYQLTDLTGVYVMSLQWSPDSDKILLNDQTGAVHLITMTWPEPEPEEEEEPATEDAEGAEDDAGEGEAEATPAAPEGDIEDAAPDAEEGTTKQAAAEAEDAEAAAGDDADAMPFTLSVETLVVNPAGDGVAASWSHDSNWVAYSIADADAMTNVIWLANLETGEHTQITDPFFNATSPAFDRAGDFLYFVTDMDFTDPSYDGWGRTFVYDQTSRLVAVPLREDVENPFLPESDEEAFEVEGAEDEDAADEGAEAGDGEEAGEGDVAADEEALPDHPLRGQWDGALAGLAALGAEEDEVAFSMTIFVDADGNVTITQEVMGESDDVDSVTWDEGSMTLTMNSEEQGIESVMTGTLDGETLSGTWSIPAMGINGTWTATRTATDTGDAEAPSGGDASDEPLVIDLEGIQGRAMMLPVDRGVLGGLVVNDKNQLLYFRAGGDGPPAIKLFDINDDDPSEGNVIAGVGGYVLSGDGKKLGVFGPAGFAIVNAAKGQSFGSTVPTNDMVQTVSPRVEWRLILRDVWRRYRDFFYVENMHGVDWDAVYAQYEPMIDDAVSRQDLDYIIGEMIAELNVGHAYNMGGGDPVSQPSVPVGLLGADFELADGAYRIKDIVRGAAWDVDAMAALSMPGVDVNEGDYLLAVNGVPIDTSRDPWAAFIGLVGDTVVLTVSESPVIDDDAREVTIETHGYGQDVGLRYRAWVEANRAYVEEKSDGRIGYIYVPDTGVNGQNELFRQFYGQMHKEALIIDDRWNGGGQIPDRFIELLDRPATNAWAIRDGRDWQWPPDSAQGPKAMLINGNAGSGGDMFPFLFRYNDLGPLIGTRTWGGLVGIGGVPPLVDNGYTTVPNFGFYDLDGTWGIEGYGVAPDIEVIDDPALLARGIDPQMDAAIEYLLNELAEGRGFTRPQRPADPDRSGMGIPEEDR